MSQKPWVRDLGKFIQQHRPAEFQTAGLALK